MILSLPLGKGRGEDYTHVGIKDPAKAVANLPTIALHSDPAALGGQASQAALHGRCNFGGSEGQSVSSSGKTDSDQKRHNPCRSKGYGNDRRQLATSVKVEAAGIERSPQSTGNSGIEPQSGAESGALDAQNRLCDADLAEVVQTWPSLPEALRAGILAMVRAARGGG